MRMRFTLVTAVVLAIAWIASETGAQMLVTRNVVVAPIVAKDSTERFPSPRFFIDASRGYGSVQDNQAWNIKMGGMFQISPWDGRSVLVGLFAHELTSNPYNSLGYNPRGAMWDENALFIQRRNSFDWHSGLFFRCRHEIDSALPTDERLPDSLHVPTSRLLGLAGVQAGITTHELVLGPRLRGRAYVRAEGYFHNKDDRAPNLPGGPDWRDALGAGTLGGRISFAPRTGAMLYGRAWMTTMTFQGTRTDGLRAASNGRAEIGVRGWGTPGGADVYTAYEYFFDDLASPLPQTSKVISIGIRVTSSEFF